MNLLRDKDCQTPEECLPSILEIPQHRQPKNGLFFCAIVEEKNNKKISQINYILNDFLSEN
jgi:hypothetical protein